jgi:hypothetical protein
MLKVFTKIISLSSNLLIKAIFANFDQDLKLPVPKPKMGQNLFEKRSLCFALFKQLTQSGSNAREVYLP